LPFRAFRQAPAALRNESAFRHEFEVSSCLENRLDCNDSMLPTGWQVAFPVNRALWGDG
jgi:hypothetical protein